MSIYLFKFKLKISKNFLIPFKNYVHKIQFKSKNKDLFSVNIFLREKKN